MRERRELERFILEVPARVEVKAEAKAKPPLDLRTSNICSGGAFFPTAEALPKGTDVSIDLDLPLDRLADLVSCKQVHVKVNGTVIRSGAAGMAVSFDPHYQIVPR
jgi:hypothetical protein